MTAILLAVLPVLVKFLTSAIKRIPVIDNTNDQSKRNIILRTIALLLSFGGIVGAYMLSGVTPDPAVLGDIVNVLGLTILTALGSFGVHEVAKNR